MIKNKIAQKTLAFALISAASFAAAPAFAQTMDDWAASCVQHQGARQAENASQFSKAAQNDPYLTGIGQKDVKGPNPEQLATGVNPGNFSCTATVKGAFDSFLKSSGSIFGIDLGSLFGNSANGICSSVNKTIGQTVGGMNIQCPRVDNIPGFSSSCSSAVRSAANTATRSATSYTAPVSTPNYSNTSSGSSSIGSNVSCWFTGNC